MNKRILSFIIIVATVLADRLTKIVAELRLHETGLGRYGLIDGFFSFTYHENRGAAFGMLSNSRWIFMSISIVAIIAIAVYLFAFSSNDRLISVSLSLIVGGGIGNMIDRVINGYVVDFLYFELIDFPIFNVADIAVTVGAVLVIFFLLFAEKKKEIGRD